MTEPEDVEEDFFADLYEGDPASSKPALESLQDPMTDHTDAPNVRSGSSLPKNNDGSMTAHQPDPDEPLESDVAATTEDAHYQESQEHQAPEWTNGQHAEYGETAVEQEPQNVGIKEDGKMFIGGLNWDTTDQSLKDYFSQFGEVVECTVMRDGATGRSRGFGFLTFRDPKTVNTVMVKEHYLDGKIIDPKRAIPRDEQERTSKIFVGGVSQEATEQDFKLFFMRFGRVLDATLMMDKETGRPRGFGFVTFDSEAAVETCLSQPLEILGKPIEVKKAQPRGNMRDADDDRGDRRYGRRGRDGHDRYDRDRDSHRNYDDRHDSSNQNQQAAAGQGIYGGMTPQMMAQYWQRMQQYFAMMQTQMAAAAAQGRGMGAGMNMAAVNPALLQQMSAMQAMSRQSSQGSPSPQGPGLQGVNPAMMQQFQQMQQLQQQAQAQAQAQAQQQQQQQQQQAAFGGGMSGGSMGPASGGPGGGGGGGAGRGGGPGYNAYEQQMFEQRKYEHQQAQAARRGGRDQGGAYGQFQGTPTSWEGMYDDVPQPNMGGGGYQRQLTPTQGSGSGRGGSQGRPSPAPQSAAPANAPTGPKNAGRPGANYRGGGRGGGNRGYHPYARP